MSSFELQVLGEGVQSRSQVAELLRHVAEEIENGEDSGGEDSGSDVLADWTLSVLGPDLD